MSSNTQLPLVPLATATAQMPIAVLPDDILYEIFMQVAGPQIEERKRPERHGRLAVSQVCRHWRNLAVASPLLWSEIYVELYSTVSMVRTFVERSRDVSLKVILVGWEYTGHFGDTYARLSEVSQVLAAASRRIVQLSIGKHWPKELAMFFLSFTIRPPLQILRICDQMQYSTWMLPDLPLAEQDLPAGGLRVDALVMCWLSCSSLTTLVLKHLRAPNVETVLFILRKCPALETLCLKFWGACAVDVRSLTSPRRPRITMRRLSSLQLSMPHKSVEQILGNLQFPATTRIRLHFDGPRNQAPSLNMLCPSLDPITSSISDATITMDDMYGYGVQLESAAGNFVVEWLCDGLIIPNRGAGLGRMAFSSLEFPSIRRLTIAAAPYDLATEDWVYLLDLTPNIDTLEITTPESLQEELFDALGNVGPSVPATDPQEPDVLCRNLKTLRIPNFPIHGSRDHLTLPVIEACFRMRGEQGAFLSSFEIGLLLSPGLPRTFVNMVENDVATLKRIIWFELRNGRRMRRGGETLMGWTPY